MTHLASQWIWADSAPARKSLEWCCSPSPHLVAPTAPGTRWVRVTKHLAIGRELFLLVRVRGERGPSRGCYPAVTVQAC